MYGPEILKVIFDVMDPLVLLSSKDTVEIYYLSGAHTHWHQRWKLIGSTAKLEKEEVISWEDDPRMKNWLKPLKPTPPSQRGYLER